MKVIHMFVAVINSSASGQLATCVTCVQYDLGKQYILLLTLYLPYKFNATHNFTLPSRLVHQLSS